MQVERRALVMARIATKNNEEALDIVQDAMIKLVGKYASKQSDEWLPLFHRILQSRIIDWHRKQKVRNRWRHFFGENGGINTGKTKKQNEDTIDALENHSLDQDSQPDEILADEQFATTLENALSQLPIRQKQAFMLRAWESYSVKETSQLMKCSEGSVKTHYARARQALQKLLKNENHEF